MRARFLLRWTAAFLGASAAAALFWFALNQPRTLKIAVGPDGSQQMVFLRSLARALVEARQPFRLEIVPRADSLSAARALDDGEVDLALVRSDDTTSGQARSIVMIQKRHVIFVARQDSPLDVAGLAARKVGVVRGESDDNRTLVRRILEHYRPAAAGAQGEADIALVDLPLSEVGSALASGAVDAAVFVAWPGQRLRRIVADLVEREGVALVFSGVPAPEALAFRYGDLEATELPAGVLGGAPPRPAQPLETVAVTYEIAAGERLAEGVAGDFARALLEARTRLRRVDDNAFFVELPPVDKQRRYMPHPGVVAVVKDEAQTWLEAYSDHIWLALFGLSILGSSITGFLAWAGLREEPVERMAGRRLAALVERLEAARTGVELDAVEAEFETLMKELIRDYGAGLFESEGSDPTPWMRLFMQLLDKRRAALRACA
jgi:TRAP-type uncharacterized transport system substrate-binding protein